MIFSLSWMRACGIYADSVTMGHSLPKASVFCYQYHSSNDPRQFIFLLPTLTVVSVGSAFTQDI